MESSSKRRKLWDESSMLSAMEVVEGKKMNIHQAAKHFSVPRKSLENRVKKRVVHGTNPGPAPVLNSEEEDALVEYVTYMARGGFPMTRKIVCAYALAIAKKSGEESRFNSASGPGMHWWTNFRKRHPKLSLRRADKLDRGRAQNANKQVIQEYFELLKKSLIESGIKDKPDRIYNCDETGMVLDSTNDKVLAPCGAKHVYSQSMGTREHITVHACACANGTMLPPMIIFAGGFPGGAYTRGGPTNALYAKSESGYMDGELYLLWFEKVFLKYCSRDRPVILIQDGHKSHMTLSMIETARRENVILFNLPPHTTHATQPLDKSIFKPLKAAFGTALKSVTFARQDYVLPKSDFPRVFCHPYDTTCTPFRIKQSFQDAGICPFDSSKIKFDMLGPSEHFQAPGTDASPTANGDQSFSPSASTAVVGDSTPASVDVTPTSTSSGGAMLTSNGTSRTCSPNPLLDAGLIPANLADILQVPQKKERTVRRRFTSTARVITADEYVEGIRQRDEEARLKEEEKRRKKEEREQKKREKAEEKERKQAEKERKKAEKEQKQAQKGKTPRGKPKKVISDSETPVQTASDDGPSPITGGIPGLPGMHSGLQRHRKPTEKARQAAELSSTDSDEGDDDDCFICGRAVPPHHAGEPSIEWISCRSCDRWYHETCITDPVDDAFVCDLCV